MDPLAAWQLLIEAIHNRDWEEARDIARGLVEWLERDGFPPQVLPDHAADAVLQRWLTFVVCRGVLAQLAPDANL